MILKLAGEHTQPTTHLKIGSGGAAGGRGDQGDESVRLEAALLPASGSLYKGKVDF